MSAAESARDARVTSTAERLLLLLLHAGVHLETCTILGRVGHAAACLVPAVAAAAEDLEATNAIVCTAEIRAAAEDGMQQADEVTGSW